MWAKLYLWVRLSESLILLITQWPHNIGPMLTYMSTCGNTTCDNFDAINAAWFKINEVGQLQNNLSQWVQEDLCMYHSQLFRLYLVWHMLLTVNGNTTSVTLPQNIAPGDYLLRHEIIALHLGNEPGGAEFYPSCSQLRISAPNNTDALSVQPSQTVSLPGAYSDQDPGVFVPTVRTIPSLLFVDTTTNVYLW